MTIDDGLARLIGELTGIRTALDRLVAVFAAADQATAHPDAVTNPGNLRASTAARDALLTAANDDPARWWTAAELVATAERAKPDVHGGSLRHATADLVKLGQLETNGRTTTARRFRIPHGESTPGDPTPPTPDPAPTPATPTTAPPVPEPTAPEPQAPSPPTPDVPDIEPTPAPPGARRKPDADEQRQRDEKRVVDALMSPRAQSLRSLAEDTGLSRREIEEARLPELLARGLVIRAGHDPLEGELWTLTERAYRDLAQANAA